VSFNKNDGRLGHKSLGHIQRTNIEDVVVVVVGLPSSKKWQIYMQNLQPH